MSCESVVLFPVLRLKLHRVGHSQKLEFSGSSPRAGGTKVEELRASFGDDRKR